MEVFPLVAACAAAVVVGAGRAQRTGRARGSNTVALRAEAVRSPAAVQQPPLLVAAAVVGEKTKSAKVLEPASRVLQRLFLEGPKVDRKTFSINCWYESPDTTTSQRDKVHDYFQTRPTRNIDRVCDGKQKAGCTWTQLDGRRGASFIRMDQDGKVTFIREIMEPAAAFKFKENNLATMKPVTSLLVGLDGLQSTIEGWLGSKDTARRESPKPKFGLEKPKTRRASDVVVYLWEEAMYAEDRPVDRVLAEFSDELVYEDLTYVDEVWPRNKEALEMYEKENRENMPKDMRFVLDDVTDGDKAACAMWHTEFGGSRSPRGITFYGVDAKGQVDYGRVVYDLSF